MKKILYITEELSESPNSGGSIKTWNTIKTLGKEYQVDVLTLTSSQKKFRKIKNINIKQVVEPKINLPIKKRFLELISNYLIANPYYFFQYQNKNFSHLISKSLKKDHYSAIHIDHLNMAQYLPKIKDQLWIYEEHNIEFLIRLGLSKQAKKTGYHWLIWLLESILIYFKEKKYLNKFDYIFTISDRDKKLIKKFFKRKENLFTYKPVIINKIKKNKSTNKSKKIKLLFLGSLDWLPNKQAINNFSHEIFPKLSRLYPTLELHLIGKNPEKINFNQKNIISHGYKKNIEDDLKNFDALIMPFSYGEGIRIKALTAIANLLPIISSKNGINGLDLKNNIHYLEANNLTDYQNQIKKVLQPKTKLKLIENSLKFIVQNHSENNNIVFLEKYKRLF